MFTEHYKKNGWGVSTVDSTQVVRTALPELIAEFQIPTSIDIPCGDFNWMKLLDLPIQYIGANIVAEIVASNQRQYTSQSRSFIKLDLTSDPLTKADLILCRSCLFHSFYEHVHQALTNTKRSGAMFLLTTTNPRLWANQDVTGEWRRLNLQAPPFCFPQPLILIDEKSLDPTDDRQLGFWRISDL